MGPQIVGKRRRGKPQVDPRSGGARRRGPRPATPERLEKAALAYLERYAAPAAQVRRVLLRRVKRSAELHGTDPEAGARAVDALVARLAGQGLIDDRAYAESKARGLSRRGASARRIAAELAAKGVAEENRALALAGIAGQPGEPELKAALAFARRRRLGPYRAELDRAARRERDLAALARQGFAYQLAQRVIDCCNLAALEEEAAGSDA